MFLNGFFLNFFMEEEKKNVEEKKEEKVEEKVEEKKVEKKEMNKNIPDLNVGKLTDKFRKNPWILSTLVLGILVLIFLVGNFSCEVTANAISEDEAGDLILELAKLQIEDAEIIDVSIKNGLYEIILSMEGNEIPVYLTLDGENLVSGTLAPIDVIMAQGSPSDNPQETPEPVGDYSEDDLEKLKVFSSCLAEKGIKIYGANWCGWTKKLAVDTLGGFDIAGDAYIECTENEELCASEEVSGYPTVKVNGEAYTGERTLEALGEETGCAVPELSVEQVSSTEDASC
jgi:hypothetical protein